MADQAVSIREINQLAVLNLLRDHPGISRSQLARVTGLGKATVSTLVSELIAKGLVREAGVGVQLGPAGRRPVRLTLNGEFRLAIGVELTGSECVAVLTDLYANPMACVRHSMRESSVETSLNLIAQSVGELLEGRDAARLLGVGVGVPGPVDAERHRVMQAENIGWIDVPFGPMLRERIGKPVVLVKRQNAGALGEYWYGIGKSRPNLIYVSVGVGIGSGIILRGELYEGANGSAGEIGHTTVVPDGQRCRCGNYGCLETLSSSPAIAANAIQEIKQGRSSLLVEVAKGALELITGKMVFEAASAGDALAIGVVQAAASHLGLALANQVNLLNPSMVIIGGDVLDLGHLFLDPVREVVRRRAFSVPFSAVDIVLSSLDYRAAPIAPATLLISRFFTPAGFQG